MEIGSAHVQRGRRTHLDDFTRVRDVFTARAAAIFPTSCVTLVIP
jgi:hypothetical protein